MQICKTYPSPIKVLGLKSANSEMNVTRLGGSTRHLAPSAAAAAANAPHGTRQQQQGRLRGTISEMNVSRIGTNEKVHLVYSPLGHHSTPKCIYSTDATFMINNTLILVGRTSSPT